MADSKSTTPDPVRLAELSDGAYEACLELQTMLQAFVELEPSPAWAFPLHRMAMRATGLADVAHIEALRFKLAPAELSPVELDRVSEDVQ